MPKTSANRNPKVDAIIRKDKKWSSEMEALRKIVLATGLTEEVKWGVPCYTLEGKNVVVIHGFKEYCALLFFKGTLMKDEYGLLIQQTKHVQAGRQIRFTNIREIRETSDVLQEYILNAIKVERSGAKVRLKTSEEYTMPEELQSRLDSDLKLKKAFNALTPGRQRGYMFYIAQAKQAKTREARIDKCTPAILKGKGLND